MPVLIYHIGTCTLRNLAYPIVYAELYTKKYWSTQIKCNTQMVLLISSASYTPLKNHIQYRLVQNRHLNWRSLAYSITDGLVGMTWRLGDLAIWQPLLGNWNRWANGQMGNHRSIMNARQFNHPFLSLSQPSTGDHRGYRALSISNGSQIASFWSLGPNIFKLNK